MASEEQLNNNSYNFICTRLKLSSLFHLNHSVNRIPESSLGEMRFEESEEESALDDCVSIEDKMP